MRPWLRSCLNWFLPITQEYKISPTYWVPTCRQRLLSLRLPFWIVLEAAKQNNIMYQLIVEKHHTSSIEENISTGEHHIECPKNFVPTKHHEEKISSGDAPQFTFLSHPLSEVRCTFTYLTRTKLNHQPEDVFHRLTTWDILRTELQKNCYWEMKRSSGYRNLCHQLAATCIPLSVRFVCTRTSTVSSLTRTFCCLRSKTSTQ